ncbi:MAG: glycosyltransferase, partial [Candidatus Omnitrophota bacterium]
MAKTPVSAVIITKNEEKNIAECLESVAWADEIILVDDESADKTREIAGKYTDKIFTRKMENEGKHRNWAYAQAS